MPPVVTDDLRACQIDAVSALERSMAANRARALNMLALNAGWDTEMLAFEIGELGDLGFDLSLTGFGDEEIAGLVNSGTTGLTDPDAVPEVPETPVSRIGDVWLLGRHRLLCGDSTNADDCREGTEWRPPHLMVTDPPYGVNYDPAWRESAGLTDGSAVARGKVLNDDRADWREAWALFPGDVAYVWHGALHATTVAQSLEACGFAVRSVIIWDKTRLVIGRGDYHWQHEPAAYCVRKSKTGHWAGGRNQTTVWQIPHRRNASGHGTEKSSSA